MPSRVSILVPPDAAGMRLDRFVADWATDIDDADIPRMSRSRIQRLIDEGMLTLGGEPARASRKLKGGEWIWLEIPEPEPLKLVPEPMPLDVLFEDEHLIAINKPAGLVVHPGAGHRHGTLVHGLLAHCHDLSGIGGTARPGIVHRLDAGTSGLIVVAKNDRAHDGLARQFAERTVEKRYVAFVLGVPQRRSATLETRYGRHPRDRKKFSSRVSRGRIAVTSYTVVTVGGGLSELDVTLGTGRTHQIRVHLADSGHPIVGDPVYGPRRLNRIERPELLAAVTALTHQALHAARLVLTHPVSGRKLQWVAPLPEDLLRLRREMTG